MPLIVALYIRLFVIVVFEQPKPTKMALAVLLLVDGCPVIIPVAPNVTKKDQPMMWFIKNSLKLMNISHTPP
jgi:hypothetical protein